MKNSIVGNIAYYHSPSSVTSFQSVSVKNLPHLLLDSFFYSYFTGDRYSRLFTVIHGSPVIHGIPPSFTVSGENAS